MNLVNARIMEHIKFIKHYSFTKQKQVRNDTHIANCRLRCGILSIMIVWRILDVLYRIMWLPSITRALFLSVHKRLLSSRSGWLIYIRNGR